MSRNIVWTAVISAVLSFISIITAMSQPDLSVAAGLAAVANAVLSTRE